MDWVEKLFQDREDAGRQLAEKLRGTHLPADTVILGLPRGGVVVAHQIAERLALPLDIILVGKLGVPGQEELAMGAISIGGVTLLNEDIIKTLQLSEDQVECAVKSKRKELQWREKFYRGDRPDLDVRHRFVVVVDDGLATGATMKAAVRALRRQEPRHLMVAVPVASEQALSEVKDKVDDMICLATPEPFCAVGLWYELFSQTSDQEVKRLIHKAIGASPLSN